MHTNTNANQRKRKAKKLIGYYFEKKNMKEIKNKTNKIYIH